MFRKHGKRQVERDIAQIQLVLLIHFTAYNLVVMIIEQMRQTT